MNGITTRRNRAHKVRRLSFIPALGTVFILSVFTVGLAADTLAADTVQVVAASEKPYVINAASFQSKETAELMLENLASSGYMAYISKATVKGVTWYRVRVGFYKSASIARKELKKIASTDKFAKSAWVSRAPLSELAPRTADIKESSAREVIKAPKKRKVKAPAAEKRALPAKKPKKAIPAAARKEKGPKPIAATNGRPVKTDAAPRRPYVINVASLQSKRDAEMLSKTLSSDGYSSYVSTANVKGKTWYRVRIGFFDRLEAAKKETKKVSSTYGAAESAWVSRAPASEVKLVKELSRPAAPSGGKLAASIKGAGSAVGKGLGSAIEKIKKIPEVVRSAKTSKPETVAEAGVKDKAPETSAETAPKETLSSTLVSKLRGAGSAVGSATGDAIERLKGIRNGKTDDGSALETKAAPVVKEEARESKGKTAASIAAGAVAGTAAGTAAGAAESASGAAAASAGTAIGATIISKLKGAGSAIGGAAGGALKGIKNLPKSVRGVRDSKTAAGEDLSAAVRAPETAVTAKTPAAQEAPKAGLLSRIGSGIKKPFSFLKFLRKDSKAASAETPAAEDRRSASVRKSARKTNLAEDTGSEDTPGGIKTTMTNIGLAIPHTLSGVGPISDKAELHGSLSISDSYSSQSNSTYSRNFLSTGLRLDATKLNDAGTLSMHFGGSHRALLSGKKYSSRVKNWRINRFYMEYAPIKDRLYLRAGRLTPKEGVGANVDGLNVLLKEKRYGVGIFAGTKPDPYTGGFNSDFTSSGAYAFYRKDQLFSNISFVHNTFKGKTDRQYLSGSVSFTPTKKTRVFGSAMSDINQESGGMDFTNGYVELSYRPDFKKSVSVGMRQFRSIRLYESMDFFINNSKQTSYYVRGNYRLLNKYSLFGKYEMRTADSGSSTTGTRETDTYMLGISKGDLFGSGVSGSLNATHSKTAIPASTYSDGYDSNYTVYDLRLSKKLIDKVNLSLNGSVMDNEYGLTDETDRTLRYGASLNIRPGRSWNLSLSYNGTKRDDYTTTNINSRVSYRF